MTLHDGARFDPGKALWDQRHEVQAASPRLRAFHERLSRLAMVMLPPDYAVLFAVVRDFKPDLIVEVGRLFGNTTCALVEAAQGVESTSVLSVCLTDHWQRTTLAQIEPLISAEWLARLDARVGNLIDLDVPAAFEGRSRILFVLDAHGWDVADYMMGVVMPELVTRRHVLLVHDVVAPAHYLEIYERYFPEDPMRPSDGAGGYGGQGVWRGTESTWDRFIFLNGLAGRYPEFVALVDFANRNHLRVDAVEASVRREIHDRPERRQEMETLVGDPMYQPWSAFAWFTAGDAGEGNSLRFPTFQGESRGDVVAELRYDLSRNRLLGRPSPLTIGRILAKAALGRYREAD